MNVYLDDEIYSRLVHSLLNIRPTSLSGRVDFSDIATVLGEVGNIWPERILPDVARAHWEERNPPPAGGERWAEAIPAR